MNSQARFAAAAFSVVQIFFASHISFAQSDAKEGHANTGAVAQDVTNRAATAAPVMPDTQAESQLDLKSETRSGQSDLAQDFTRGIQAFKKNDLQSAAASFQTVLSKAPSNTSVLHNLALTEWKLGQTGLAMALWRKANMIDPSYEPAARSIKWFRGRLDHPEIAHEVEYWETFREDFLSHLSIGWLVGFSALTLSLSGSLLLSYLGAKRRAAIDETAPPEFPGIGTGGGIVFAVLLMLIGAKIYDNLSPRGTILPTKVPARSAPDSSGTALFDLYAGLEVQIDEAPEGWFQVTYPGGPTGWIPASTLMRTTDPLPSTAAQTPASPQSPRSNIESPKAGA